MLIVEHERFEALGRLSERGEMMHLINAAVWGGEEAMPKIDDFIKEQVAGPPAPAEKRAKEKDPFRYIRGMLGADGKEKPGDVEFRVKTSETAMPAIPAIGL